VRTVLLLEKPHFSVFHHRAPLIISTSEREKPSEHELQPATALPFPAPCPQHQRCPPRAASRSGASGNGPDLENTLDRKPALPAAHAAKAGSLGSCRCPGQPGRGFARRGERALVAAAFEQDALPTASTDRPSAAQLWEHRGESPARLGTRRPHGKGAAVSASGLASTRAEHDIPAQRGWGVRQPHQRQRRAAEVPRSALLPMTAATNQSVTTDLALEKDFNEERAGCSPGLQDRAGVGTAFVQPVCACPAAAEGCWHVSSGNGQPGGRSRWGPTPGRSPREPPAQRSVACLPWQPVAPAEPRLSSVCTLRGIQEIINFLILLSSLAVRQGKGRKAYGEKEAG